jgi:hypothetical protein
MDDSRGRGGEGRMREIMPIISDSVEGPLADTSVQGTRSQGS